MRSYVLDKIIDNKIRIVFLQNITKLHLVMLQGE